jgi:hypothetical protein
MKPDIFVSLLGTFVTALATIIVALIQAQTKRTEKSSTLLVPEGYKVHHPHSSKVWFFVIPIALAGGIVSYVCFSWLKGSPTAKSISMTPSFQATSTVVASTKMPNESVFPLRVDTDVKMGELEGRIYLGVPSIPSTSRVDRHSDSWIHIYDFELLTSLTKTEISACSDENNAMLEVGIINIGGNESVKIANAPIITVDSIEDVNYSQPIHLIEQQPAGGGFYEEYYFDLDKSKLGKKFGVSPLDSTQIPDFYTLAVREEEWFMVFVHCEEPGIYRFRVGIEYTYKGTKAAFWQDKDIIIVSPNEYFSWYDAIDYPGETSYISTGHHYWDVITHTMRNSATPLELWKLP